MTAWAHSPVITIAALIIGAVIVCRTLKVKSMPLLVPGAWLVCYSLSDAFVTGFESYVEWTVLVPYFYLVGCSAIFFIVTSIKRQLRQMARVFLLLSILNVAMGAMAYFFSTYYYSIGQGKVEYIWGWIAVAYFIVTLASEAYLFYLGCISANRNNDSDHYSGGGFSA